MTTAYLYDGFDIAQEQIGGSASANKLGLASTNGSRAQTVAQQIADRIVDPYGADFLHRAAVATGDESFHDLDPFIYASSEWEDRLPDR